jgi:hypothetical protein
VAKVKVKLSHVFLLLIFAFIALGSIFRSYDFAIAVLIALWCYLAFGTFEDYDWGLESCITCFKASRPLFTPHSSEGGFY